MKKLDELEQLRERVAVLEGRADALSMVLHSSIIMTDDALRMHRKNILALISGFADHHPNAHARAVLFEWIHNLSQTD